VVALAAACSTLSCLSCARIEPPPGGPPDTSPPQLLSTRPDSFAQVPNFKGDVEFHFDEVVSEGGSPNQGTGSGDLEKLIILSPTTRVPHVSWRRDRIAVRPAEGWRPNLVYRVELLPGVTDLRRNQSKRGAVLTFTTGAPLPATTIDGTVVDWTTSRPVPTALVEALHLGDSLPYRGQADSTGHFALGPLPAGDYLVRGVIDQNRNNLVDPREAFDTVRLAKGKTAAGELWAFVHDTTPPRIQEVTATDSTGATVTLSQPLDPRQRLRPEAVTVRALPDSTPVRVTALRTKSEDDSLAHPSMPVPDSLRDTTRKARPGGREAPPAEAPPPRGRGLEGQARAQPAALTSRPPLTDKVVVRVERPWTPGGRYEVDIKGVRNVTGVAGDVRGGFTAPKATPPDTTRLKGGKPAVTDTTKRPAAGAKPKPPADSTGRPPPKPKP
jgi:hypothetical protein